MATKLNLKKRKDESTIVLTVGQVQSLLVTGNRETLWDFFKAILEKDVKDYTHDKVWLEVIVNWVPEGGLPMTTMAKWFKLAAKVATLDDTKEGTITLSDFQVGLIWGRLNNEQFKLVRLSPQLVGFITDFQEASGRHFEEEEPDKQA